MRAAILLPALFSLLILFSCRKDSFITGPDAIVRVTVDTLKYDTVFTQTGSVTQSFKIVNENDKKLRLSSVKLMGGVSSSYSMNVDGTAAQEVTNVDIEANDSVYVFVKMNIDPTIDNLPFIIRDSIQIAYNGNKRLVQLEAWGQNAHFLRGEEIEVDEVWTNDLPYVILDYLLIAENARLTVEKGCRIYLHADAPIVVDGSLVVNGEKDSVDRVYFRGDRLDEPYRDFPAAWPGIYFTETSYDNVMSYAVIRNAYQSIGVIGPSVNANPKLVLNECIIDNSFDAGIIAANSSIDARNCLVSNCGKNIVLFRGGDYNFTHCTVASISNQFIPHRDPVLQVSNTDGLTSFPLNASFRNCIFWGENGIVENEVVADKDDAAAFNVVFEHVLWKVQTQPSNVSIVGNPPINNENPLFDSIDVSKNFYNFRLKDNSPAIDKGVITTVGIDLDGNPRPINLPDLGSYEHN